MPLDPEAFSDLVIETVERAIGPLVTRVAVLEATRTTPEQALATDDIADMARSLLRKELDTLTAAAPPKMQKRIEMPDGRIVRVTEEPI